MINLTFTVGIPLHCPGWDPTTLLFHLLVVLVGIPPLSCFTYLLSWLGSHHSLLWLQMLLGSHHSLVPLNSNMYGMVAFLLGFHHSTLFHLPITPSLYLLGISWLGFHFTHHSSGLFWSCSFPKCISFTCLRQLPSRKIVILCIRPILI